MFQNSEINFLWTPVGIVNWYSPRHSATNSWEIQIHPPAESLSIWSATQGHSWDPSCREWASEWLEGCQGPWFGWTHSQAPQAWPCPDPPSYSNCSIQAMLGMLLLCSSSPLGTVPAPPATYTRKCHNTDQSCMSFQYWEFALRDKAVFSMPNAICVLDYFYSSILESFLGKKEENEKTRAERWPTLTFFLVSGSTKGASAFVIGKSLAVDKKNSSQGASNNMPCPSLPLRPVLPSRCIYCSLSDGKPTWNYRNIFSRFKPIAVWRNILKSLY